MRFMKSAKREISCCIRMEEMGSIGNPPVFPAGHRGVHLYAVYQYRTEQERLSEVSGCPSQATGIYGAADRAQGRIEKGRCGCMVTLPERYYKEMEAERISCIPCNKFKPVLSRRISLTKKLYF